MFTFWITSLILGLISLPFSSIFFPKPYAFAKIIGVVVISYTMFLLASLWLVPLGFWSLIAIISIWLILNIIIYKKKKIVFDKKDIFISELVFTSLYIFLIFIKSHSPEIYQIERFMDFGFIKAIQNSKFLPVEDIWLAGKPLNYYYFGHFTGYVLVTLANVPLEMGFYLLCAWLFGVVGLAVSKIGNWMSIFFVLFAGSWQPIFEAISKKPFWYANTTRIIPGTISEMPLYSFIVAELHAHVWGMINGVVILALLFSLWADKKIDIKKIILIGFTIGISIMTNTWDAMTLGGLTLVILFFKKSLSNFIKISLIALVVALPWLFFFSPPVSHIAIVKSHSPIFQWIQFWGAIVIIPLIYFIKNRYKNINSIIIFCALSLLIFIEIIYFQDVLKDGEWFRANTYFKVTTQVWLWLGIVSGPIFVNYLKKIRPIWQIGLICLILSMSVYPVKAIYQSSLENKKLTGISTGLSWWEKKYPNDYSAYLFLKNIDGKHVILEAEGESYTDTSRFSTFLGWPTIAGWSVHEWTWHGEYPTIGNRGMEVREVYLGQDINKAKEILVKYKVEYIVVGQVEKQRYKEAININKLNDLGNILYQNSQTTVFQVKGSG